MLRKRFFIRVLIAFILISGNVSFSQEQMPKSEKKPVEAGKPLDVFITDSTKSKGASEPVPGAEITVEQGTPVIIKSASAPEKVELASEKIERRIYVNLAGAGVFSSDFPKPVLIPKIGLGATFGFFGISIDGQAFNSSPEFDFNRYLEPVRSVLSVSVQRENNSNLLLGISPYLNFGIIKTFTIQTGLGIRYLIQNGASVSAVYEKEPPFQVLKLPEEDATRNLIMLEPNIRAMFGKPENLLRFYFEVAYSIPTGANEYNFISRDLTGVVRDGKIIIDALLKSPLVTEKTIAIPGYMTLGFGISVNLFRKNSVLSKEPRSNGKKALDAFITATTKSTVSSEPVPGAEIIVEFIEASPSAKSNGIYIPDTAQEKPQKGKKITSSNDKGEVQLIVPEEQFKKLPEEFYLKFTIKPKGPNKYPVENNSVVVKVKKSDGPKFEFEVTFERNNVKTNKGTFAVNAKAQT